MPPKIRAKQTHRTSHPHFAVSHTLSVEFGKEEKIVESFFALKKSLPIVQNRDPNTLKITHNNDDTEVEIESLIRTQ